MFGMFSNKDVGRGGVVVFVFIILYLGYLGIGLIIDFVKQDVVAPVKAWQNTDKVAEESFHARYGDPMTLVDGTKVKVLEQYHLPALVGVTQWDVANGVDLMAMATPANRVEHCADSPLFVGKEIALPTENPDHMEGPAVLYHVGRKYFVKSVTGKADNWATIYQYDDRSACLTKLTIDKNGAGYAHWPREGLYGIGWGNGDYALSHGMRPTTTSYKHGHWTGGAATDLVVHPLAKDVDPDAIVH